MLLYLLPIKSDQRRRDLTGILDWAECATVLRVKQVAMAFRLSGWR